MRIFITGFMASGKTTYGKSLAKEMGFNFIDLDNEIEKKTNKSISEIFRDHGEKYFRELEYKYLQECFKKDHCVIATGGGVVTHHHNMKAMNKHGLTLFLKVNTDKIIERLVQDRAERPLIKEMNIKELKDFVYLEIKKRMKYYSQAGLIINPEILKAAQFSLYLNERFKTGKYVKRKS